ncbi:MAG: EamA family transporter [Desulfobacterales bacterium]
MAILLVLLSAAMHAFRNFFNKKALDKQAFVWWYEVFGLIFFTPLFLFTLLHAGTNTHISIAFIFLSGFVHFIYWYFLSKALEKGDLSLIYPIMRSSPALVLIFSITILGENVSALGVTGILLVAIGVYTINMESLVLSELLRPFRAMTRDRAIQFAFLTLFSVACYTLVDKIAVSQMHPVIFAYIYPWISLSLFSGYLFKAKSKDILKKEWALRKGSILVCGVLSIFGYFLILVAFTMERMSYVAGLRQLSIVFAVLLGGHLLKEKNKKIRIASSIVIFLGAYLIAVAD